MKQNARYAHYEQIAYDLAMRVATGTLSEGDRIYGRSVLASQYGVSPETIRRALCLLDDVDVVEVRPQSGTVVLSADNARRYIETRGESVNLLALQEKLQDLIRQSGELNRQVEDIVSVLLKSQRTVTGKGVTVPHYEIEVPEGSPLIGQSIGALQFRQSTGATIVAIRRTQATLLSPDPDVALQSRDKMVLVGSVDAIKAAHRLVTGKETEI